MNALCNLSRKKSREVAASLPGRFLSRRCFTLCITMEVEPRIAKQYKCHHCCSCKNYGGKGMDGRKKVSLRRFWADPRDLSDAWQKSRELTTRLNRSIRMQHIPHEIIMETLTIIRHVLKKMSEPLA